MDEKSYTQRQYRRLREKKAFGMHLSRKDHAELEALSHKSGFVYRNYVPRRRRRTSLREYLSTPARLKRDLDSVPAEVLSERVPASQPFRSVVDRTWLSKQRAHMLKVSFGLWGAPVMVGTTVWNILTQNDSQSSIEHLLIMFGEDLTVMVPSGLLLFGVVLRRNLQMSRGAVEHNRIQFKQWFKERYGVALSKGSLTKLQSSIEGRYAFSSATQLKDEAGVKYLLTNNGGLALSRINESGAEVLIHAERPKAIEGPKPVVLSGEAQVMHDNLASLMARAVSCELSVEQEHIVNRVREDLAGGLGLYRQLVTLDRVEDGVSLFCNLLGEWIEEINGVLNAQTQGVLNQLRVAQTYARERKMLPSASRLQLPAASSEAMASKSEVVS